MTAVYKRDILYTGFHIGGETIIQLLFVQTIVSVDTLLNK
jgi:hypothetical protein